MILYILFSHILSLKSCTYLTQDSASKNSHILPWLVWVSGLSTGLQTKGLLVRFPIRAHTWAAGQVPSRKHARGNQTLMFLSLVLLPFLSLKIINGIFKKKNCHISSAQSRHAACGFLPDQHQPTRAPAPCFQILLTQRHSTRLSLHTGVSSASPLITHLFKKWSSQHHHPCPGFPSVHQGQTETPLLKPRAGAPHSLCLPPALTP